MSGDFTRSGLEQEFQIYAQHYIAFDTEDVKWLSDKTSGIHNLR
ncbi:MAG: hypothetical protein KH024_09735 [Hungatella hathewayi]|nr:hypothetical protein [Hungatella hathewayi]